MGQALYRKYRSRTLAEIAGQEHITSTLDRAIKQGMISHAYLFTGPRGVGKTSIARIVAHEINELPYTDESVHLDIIEIDAASNRRIDEIRDLRDKVHIAPTSAKYKVYIIDEVHMLTREAFNALLKTLEEPPAHVVFILATTELHKLPETIISRTQRFTFKPIDTQTAVDHLANIAKSENINIEASALELLAEHGQGSFRDSISLLDQISGGSSKITAQDVRTLIGLASTQHIEQIIEAVLSTNPSKIASALNDCIADGVNPAQIAKQLSANLRARIISAGKSEDSKILLDLLEDLVAVPASVEPTSTLEIALLRAHLSLHSHLKSEPQPKNVAQAAPAPIIKAPAPTATIEPKPTNNEMNTPDEPAVEPEVTAIEEPNKINGGPAEWWNEVLNHIKSANNTLYGILRMAEPQLDNDTLHLSFGFGFHKKKVSDSETQAKIHEAITKVTGSSYKINAVHDKNLTKSALPAVESAPEITPEAVTEPISGDLKSITNIFGGAEVLES